MWRLWFGLALAALPIPVQAQNVADLSTADNGVLATRMIVTHDIEGFWKAWDGPTPPHIQTTDTITRSQPVFATLVFAGCRAAENGNCKISASFTILAPDGSVYGQQGPMHGWSGPPAPGRNMLVVEGYLGFELEVEDKLGAYVVKGVLKDEVAGTSLSVQATIIAKPDGPVQAAIGNRSRRSVTGTSAAAPGPTLRNISG